LNRLAPNKKYLPRLRKSHCIPSLRLLHPLVDSNQFDGMLKLVPLLAGFLSCQCCAMTLANIEASFTKRKG